MKRIIILSLLLLGFNSCQHAWDCCGIHDASIEMSVKSVDGTDLLDPEKPEFI